MENAALGARWTYCFAFGFNRSVQRAGIRVFAENAPSSARVLEFWMSSRIGAVKGKNRSDNLPFSTQPNCLGRPTRVADISDPNLATERGRAKNIHLFEYRVRERRTYSNDPRPGWSLRYPGEDSTFATDAGVKLTITRQSQGPIYPFASGVPRYIGLGFP